MTIRFVLRVTVGDSFWAWAMRLVSRSCLAGPRSLTRLGPRRDLDKTGHHGHTGREAIGWQALTPTETKIAYLIARGQSNPDIAAELFLSRNTVQSHVSHILAKLGARSRAGIVREALDHPAARGSALSG